MIKCPKCSFEQPEDIYCANCGVNMKSYRPSPVPLMKAFLGSWMGKVFLITLLIIGALVYDLQKTKDKPSTEIAQTARSQTTAGSQNYDSTPPPAPVRPVQPAPPPQQVMAQAGAATRASRFEKVGAKKAMTMELNNSAPPPAAAAATHPILKVSFYSASRGGVQDLQRDSMAAGSGDALAGVFPQKKLASMGTELKSLASSRYKVTDPPKPIIVYKGQRTTDVKLGLYFQITPLRIEGGSMQVEIKCWGNMKLQETDETFFTVETTVNPQQAAFIAGFVPRDKVLNEDEKAIVDADTTLKIYNQDDFLDGSSDLIMIVEMTQGA